MYTDEHKRNYSVLLKVHLEVEKLIPYWLFGAVTTLRQPWSAVSDCVRKRTGLFFSFYHGSLIFPVPLSLISLVLIPSAWLLNKVTALVTRQRAAYLSLMQVMTEGSAVGK